MEFPENTLAVINCAGENVLNPLKRWNAKFQKTVYDSRISTNQFLVETIKESVNKPKVFISMSGVGTIFSPRRNINYYRINKNNSPLFDQLGIYKPDPVKEYDEYTKIEEGFDYISKLAIDWEKASELPENVADIRRVVVRSGILYNSLAWNHSKDLLI